MVSMKFVIFGSPGAGKGTYARRLQEQLGIAAVSTGDIFRDAVKQGTGLGKNAKTFMDTGELVPDGITNGILEERLQQPDAQRGFILDGYPRTTEQIEFLEKITKIDAVINLVVPEWVIIERLSSRRSCKKCGAIYNTRFLKPKTESVCDKCEGELFQRDDDKPEAIKVRLRVYEEKTQPLLEFFRKKGVEIVDIECNDVDIPPEIMVDKILKALKERKPIE
jgi:adenylate kinase